MNDRALPDDPLLTRTEGNQETIDLPEGSGFFNPGEVLGDRYEILEMLGRGGMGEVWRAFDLKLRVEVGLKALREELFQSERRLELLRQEVRAAREVVSPNVCRIFDLIEIDGRELVSMEYVDGATLLGVLQERGPLELKEAQDIASQFLSGLEAIHKAGLVHRDVKPENIMLTRAGRVVVMDFGLARGPESGAGSVSGTPAYMAPEHAAGQDVDARADVYSAGVVLAEMVSPDGIKSYESRQSVWEGVRSDPAQVPDSPWAPVIKRAVARDRERRQNSAHTLIRELEDVTLRVEGAEDLHPYPGLASFTEEDAEYFFGREADVEQMWHKLEGPPRMLGLIGPSGAGKSSFIKAGVIPHASAGWSIITCTPGDAAFRSLSQEVASELAGDAEAIRELVDIEDLDTTVSAVARWRSSHTQALLIVDQFEELFTQNAAEVQARFAELLGRLTLEADVFVLLSMRDDFFFNCHQFEALKPVVTELTLLGPPTGAALRRALVQPATKCGYRFEDDELVEEMLTEVEGERGALPALAFALARLWEKRDRETGLLTRQAYHDIGGVGGALARHAEATIDHIGVERIPVVRELFRNLVTAEGTRAVREWNELLSVFEGTKREGIKPSPTKNPPTTVGPGITPARPSATRKSNVGAGFTPARDAASDVLAELIDARLLTSYEDRNEDEEPTRRVEIIHESLLANWPRLVRWQTQDADATQLRDELRQAARTWDEHDRADDLLWTGSTYREFIVWRERYPGGVSEVEDAFANAMTGLASRRRLRRRMVTAVVFLVAIGVAALVSGLLTLVHQKQLETRRAEAAKLLALGRFELDAYPTAALAYVRTSLETADTPAGRQFAVEALWRGPPAHVLTLETGEHSGGGFFRLAISPDGQWLATSSFTGLVLLFPRDGGPSKMLQHPTYPGSRPLLFTPDGDTLITVFESIRLWSVPEGDLIRQIESEMSGGVTVVGDRLLALGRPREDKLSLVVKSWSLDGDWHETLGTVELNLTSPYALDPTGRFLAYAQDGSAYLRPLEEPAATNEKTVGPPDENIVNVDFSDNGDFLALSTSLPDGSVRVLVWPLEQDSSVPLRVLEPVNPDDFFYPRSDPTGSLLAMGSGAERAVYLWDLDGPPDADPAFLRRSDVDTVRGGVFGPAGQWLATVHSSSVSFWPLGWPRVRVLRGHEESRIGMTFTADGRWLVSRGYVEGVRLWPLTPTVGTGQRLIGEGWSFAAHPTRQELLLATGLWGPVVLMPLDGGPTRELIGEGEPIPWGAAFDREGRLAAVAGCYAEDPENMLLRIVDLQTGEVQVLNQVSDTVDSRDNWDPMTGSIWKMEFTSGGTLYSAGWGGVRRWDLETGIAAVFHKAGNARMDISPDGRYILVAGSEWIVGCVQWSELRLFDLENGTSREVTTHGSRVNSLAFDPSGRIIVSGDAEGVVRVGPVTGEEPHLLLGHDGCVDGVAVSPDGRWVFSSAGTEIRQWPMPDLSKPPLHTLPREELIAKLKTLTNLRVVRDPESTTGWTLTHDPFPGWETVPTW